MPAKKISNHYVTPKTKLDYSRSIFPYEKTHSANILTGGIYPMGILRMQPGDTAPNKFGFVLQSAPLLSPSFDNIYCDVIAIWCPTRLVMANHNEWLGDNDTYAWTLGNNISYPKITNVNSKYIAANKEISKAYQSEHYLAPHIGYRLFVQGGNVDGSVNHSLYDSVNSPYHNGINVITSRIYDLNWNSLFRNENVQNPVLFSKQSGTDLSLDVTNYQVGLGVIRKANRLKNMFTTARLAPAIQSVDIGLGKDLPVLTGATHPTDSTLMKWNFTNGYAADTAGALGIHSNSGTYSKNDGSFTGAVGVVPSNLWADLSQLTVNNLYYSIMLQKYMNKASMGRRPVEFYREFFGISDSDVIHDMPQLISQKRFKVNISRVVATANSDDAQSNTQPLGSQGAFSVTSVGGTLFPEFTATEYGELHVYFVIRTQESFSSGIDRDLAAGDLLSTYLPIFDHIGWDAVYLRELADMSFALSPTNEVFGYQEAWYWRRYFANDAVGIIAAGEPLEYFTLARDFDSGLNAFTVNTNFIEQSPFEVDRMLQFPVFYGTPNSTGFDANGEAFKSNRYQWLVQFAIAGDFTRTMSKNSEPLIFGRL